MQRMTDEKMIAQRAALGALADTTGLALLHGTELNTVNRLMIVGFPVGAQQPVRILKIESGRAVVRVRCASLDVRPATHFVAAARYREAPCGG